MILDARQSFTLAYPGPYAQSLAFVQDPAVALAQVRFLRGLQADAQGVRGELVVTVPILGEVDLPFVSRLQLTADGAALVPQQLAGERAWVEVSGQARAGEDGTLHFDFEFRAHLAVPEAEGWGGAAFEKMVGAAAGRTLERVARELPDSVARAIPAV
ncbi:DUF3809 domain-containing protein [Deinococcus deserti]|uniref:DUF3809 domain-containing protein n=1 Tax=Deinococcus deserti (strain DSM 17065 / CIP 109153 / LMG 22923 / VCD115) TaxID=546414 RepID=C1CY20_DEIDV|nr:DUF3809 domain-containing protein [Deinococcus deserti]ACO46976.1 hypothetical protein Deide_19741 [Deinococcus deserti VCD115]